METVSTCWIFNYVFHGIFVSKCLLNGLIPTTNPRRISNWKFDISHSWESSRFLREVDNSCVLLGCYAASSVNSFPTFRDNLPYSRKNPWRLDRKVVPKRRRGITITRFVITQKSAVLTSHLIRISVSSSCLIHSYTPHSLSDITKLHFQ